VHCTNPGNPVFVYDPVTRNAAEGFTGRGPVVLAVDNLPCELPRDASQYFGEMLNRYIPALARCDWNRPWNELALPEEIRKAILVHRGRFTPDYGYLETHVAR
jgi:alpha-aminoadipic semialdehyde synthase